MDCSGRQRSRTGGVGVVGVVASTAHNIPSIVFIDTPKAPILQAGAFIICPPPNLTQLKPIANAPNQEVFIFPQNLSLGLIKPLNSE